MKKKNKTKKEYETILRSHNINPNGIEYMDSKLEENNVVASHHGLGVHHGMLGASNPIVGVVAGQQDHHHQHHHHNQHHHVMHNHNHHVHEVTLMSHQHLGGMLDNNNNVGNVNDQGMLGLTSFDTSSTSLGFVHHQSSIPNGDNQVTNNNNKEIKTRKYNKTGNNKKRTSAQINKDNSNEDEKRLKQEPVR